MVLRAVPQLILKTAARFFVQPWGKQRRDQLTRKTPKLSFIFCRYSSFCRLIAAMLQGQRALAGCGCAWCGYGVRFFGAVAVVLAVLQHILRF
tara:strand:+ start:235 stop:513 length:279 start_codon:yes stop_codon:yes gene_type:complete